MIVDRTSRRLLIYEPRVEGHHLNWLRYILDDLLQENFALTVALDTSPAASDKVAAQLGPCLDAVQTVPVRTKGGDLIGGSHLAALQRLLDEFSPPQIFLCELDEIASSISRRTAFGFSPPEALKGRIGGIYFRPRHLTARLKSLNNFLKFRGFLRLLKEKWFRQILVVDEGLFSTLQKKMPGNPFYFLPDPCPPNFKGSRFEARQKLGLPENKTIFLFFGGPYRRKGLHLAVEAFQNLQTQNFLLLCAGVRQGDMKTERGIKELITRERAHSINRFVTSDEEKLCFQAADFVLLPYINHFGASSVLSSAVAAEKPVIVSGEQLIGLLTKEYRLGITFKTNDVRALEDALVAAMKSTPEQLKTWALGSKQYSLIYSREMFKKNLLHALV